MKYPIQLFLAAALCTPHFNTSGAATDAPSLAPTVDASGRFWVYRNGPSQPRMPFIPYGFMSDVTNNLPQMLRVDVESRDQPNAAFKPPPGRPERECCIQIKVAWDSASWAGVAFISGPDKPAWWGESNRGRYYNLGNLPQKKLVFYARGERGGESIKVQIGVLGGKPFGDSLSKPIVSEELKLTSEWTRQEVDFKDVPNTELAKICNGFGIVADQASQPGPGTETKFYIDDIYFE
jgi:hypothetical protein